MQTTVNVAGASTVLSGDVNPATGEMKLETTGTTALQALITGSDAYIKSPAFAALNIPGWMHIDLSKLRVESSLRQGLNPAANLGVLAGATEITETSPGTFEGKIDLEKAAQAASDPQVKSLLDELVKQSGTATKDLPFTAKVDSEGRLTSFSNTLPAAGSSLKTEIVFTEFGKAVTVTKPPAAEITEAPAEVYQFI